MEAKELEFPTCESFKVWFDEKTKDHPMITGKRGRFFEDLSQGKVPIEFLREYCKQFYIFINLTNAYLTWTLVNFIDLWREHPDLYEAVAAKMGSEMSDPGPGGHARTFVKFTRYIGLRDEDLFHAKAIPEMEVRFLAPSLYRPRSPAQVAVAWMLEGFVGYSVRAYRQILRGKYAVPDEMLEYWEIHEKADLEEHGPEGETFLTKLYQLGMVTKKDYPGMRMQVERSVSTEDSLSWADVLWARYVAEHS